MRIRGGGVNLGGRDERRSGLPSEAGWLVVGCGVVGTGLDTL